MAAIQSYHRPADLDAALSLLERNEVQSAILAGGTALNAERDRAPSHVVDLQAVGLDAITLTGALMTVGAMVRLQDLIDHPATPLLIADAARREGPNTLRNAATVGGTIATGEHESELLASLLVHEAVVSIADRGGTRRLALDAFLASGDASGDGIIIGTTFTTGGNGSIERTGRTPADRAIVAAVGRRSDDGQILVALTGVAATPVLIGPAGPDGLNPPGDFRGSPEYRRALAGILTDRVVAALRDPS